MSLEKIEVLLFITKTKKHIRLSHMIFHVIGPALYKNESNII